MRLAARSLRRPVLARLLHSAYGSFLRFTAHSKRIGNDRDGSAARAVHDPELPSKIGPMNGHEARESGHWADGCAMSDRISTPRRGLCGGRDPKTPCGGLVHARTRNVGDFDTIADAVSSYYLIVEPRHARSRFVFASRPLLTCEVEELPRTRYKLELR